MSNNKTQQQSSGPLTFEIANAIAGALSRLEELAAYSVKLPAHDAEIRGTHEFLANTFINHGAEFLGCWFTVRREYEPALKAIAQIAFRVRAILSPSAVSVRDDENGSEPANPNVKQLVNIDS